MLNPNRPRCVSIVTLLLLAKDGLPCAAPARTGETRRGEADLRGYGSSSLPAGNDQLPARVTLGRFPNRLGFDSVLRTMEFAMPIALRDDFDAAQLRSEARTTKDSGQARRLLALAAIYDGSTRTEAAKIGGVTLQIVRDWVMKFNARGPSG